MAEVPAGAHLSLPGSSLETARLYHDTMEPSIDRHIYSFSTIKYITWRLTQITVSGKNPFLYCRIILISHFISPYPSARAECTVMTMPGQASLVTGSKTTASPLGMILSRSQRTRMNRHLEHGSTRNQGKHHNSPESNLDGTCFTLALNGEDSK